MAVLRVLPRLLAWIPGQALCGAGRSSLMVRNKPTMAWAITLALALAMLVPMVAGAGGPRHDRGGVGSPGGPVVPQSLLDAATAHPTSTFRVVVQGGRGTRSAAVGDAVTAVTASLPATATKLRRRFNSIDGVAATLTGKQILRLAGRRGISAITPDTTLRPTGYENAEMWRQTSNLQQLAAPSGAGPRRRRRSRSSTAASTRRRPPTSARASSRASTSPHARPARRATSRATERWSPALPPAAPPSIPAPRRTRSSSTSARRMATASRWRAT